ncbi:MAG: MBL fold metallo-hydrolase [Proteobacteria bacterium]|nr:MBL fold metallo-hydrolase [Pseudomonadota bacterium]
MKIIFRNTLTMFCLALTLFTGHAASQSTSSSVDPLQAVPTTREIVHISGDLNRVQNGAHYTVYLVTSKGIILADPLSTDFAMWLKVELANRYDVPVRYVLYSHHHFDHASGAHVFDDIATLVGHKNFPSARKRSIENWPVQVILNDKNSNGSLDRIEATGLALARFDLLDINRDDMLSSAEIHAQVSLPEVYYEKKMSITLGDKTVELMHPGSNHTEDSSVLFFPEERVIYGVDFVNVGRLAIAFPGTGTLQGWIESIKNVEALNFNIVTPGHSSVGTKKEFTAYREYFEELRITINQAVENGTSLEELIASDALVGYNDLPNYMPWRDINIEKAYELARSENN